MMTGSEKVNFFNLNKDMIDQQIKTKHETKAFWRKLFWTTARDSDKYQAGYIKNAQIYFPNIFSNLINKNKMES